jgi:hypothetical protein
MKKILVTTILLFCGLFISNSVYAQTRTKITNDLTLVRYGNVSVIEDDKNQMTWNLSVTREKKSTGEWIYYVACENKYTKTVLKTGLSLAINGAVSSTGIGVFGSAAVAAIATTFYDDVCAYFED